MGLGVMEILLQENIIILLQVGDNGTLKVASSTGFGLTVGIAANLDGSVNFVTT